MRALGFHPDRNLPTLYKTTLNRWFKKQKYKVAASKGKVLLFNDEFSNYNDVEIGIKAVKLLQALGYEVVIPQHGESGRTYISKGLLRTAQRIAERNVELLYGKVTAETPLIGLEPSAILSFRDEYPSLVRQELREKATTISTNALLFEEFIAREVEKDNISPELFTDAHMAVARLWNNVYSNAIEPGWVATKLGGANAPDSLKEGYKTQACSTSLAITSFLKKNQLILV